MFRIFSTLLGFALVLQKQLIVFKKSINLHHIPENFMFCFVFSPPDPFGGDPFKGSDPFATDNFFTQTASSHLSSDDPFCGSTDPFGNTADAPEPDLFAAKRNDPASATAAEPDPFTSQPTNPAAPAADPFSSTGKDTAQSDPFPHSINATGDSDPFGSQYTGKDPFSTSPPSAGLALVSPL